MKRFATYGGLALGVLFLSACPHNTGEETGVYSTRTQVLLANEQGDAVPIADGQRLRTGDVFAVTVELSSPAHIYIIHRKGGTLSDLYPGLGASDRELGPGVVRIPNNDSWMRVPNLGPKSQMCVLLSARTLDGPQRHCTVNPQHHPGQPLMQSFVLTP